MLKDLAKIFIPDSVISALRRWRDREKLYWSWKGASIAARASYSRADLTAFRIARARAVIGREEEFVKPYPELLEMFDQPSGHFVDFGGATGEMCAILQKRFPAWSFTVVETKAIVEASHELRPSISFMDTMPSEFDVFYCSGTLQYLDDPEGVWRNALGRTRRYAYLARNAFSKRKQFRVQTSQLFDNGAGPIPQGFSNAEIQYPHRTISEKAIVKIASYIGFELSERIENRNTGVVGKDRAVYGADLIFKRR